MFARLDVAGVPIGRPVIISEDCAGRDALLQALGEPPALIAMEATGHHWKNLYAILAAAGARRRAAQSVARPPLPGHQP